VEPKVADVLIDRLAEWGVHRIYGDPGYGINSLTSALRRAGDRFEFVQVRHEEAAALMACAHAKFGGGFGPCMVTSGIRVTDASEVAGGSRTALKTDRPVVIDAVVDPNVPPLPPHISFQQVAAMMKAILKGDPDRAAIVRESMRELVAH
jgi:thiamine pyrophosphate-dependent acetolactate synthase large subunit-like protein